MKSFGKFLVVIRAKKSKWNVNSLSRTGAERSHLISQSSEKRKAGLISRSEIQKVNRRRKEEDTAATVSRARTFPEPSICVLCACIRSQRSYWTLRVLSLLFAEYVVSEQRSRPPSGARNQHQKRENEVPLAAWELGQRIRSDKVSDGANQSQNKKSSGEETS